MSKFGNETVGSTRMLDPYTGGRSFRSKEEFKHALFLLSELQAKKIVNFVYEKQYELTACDVSGFSNIQKHVGFHRPDFTVYYQDGREEVHEIKGGNATKTEAWALRKRIFEINYPYIKYRVFDFGREWKARVIQCD